MPIFTYETYMNLIPSKTKDFVNQLLRYLYYSERIELSRFNIVDEKDKLFYKALRAYKDSDEVSRNALKILGFTSDVELNSTSLYESTAKKLFTDYYDAFTPFSHEEEYLALTPEDIIKNIYERVLSKDKEYRTYNLLEMSPDKFIKKLYELSLPAKQQIINGINTSFNKNYSISVINFYNMAGKIYLYLRDNQSKLTIPNTNNIDLSNLAQLLALFYYDHVSTYKDSYNEKQLIIDYFASKGLTKELIESKLGISIKEKDLTYDPTLILQKEFTKTRMGGISRDNYTVGLIIHYLINATSEDALIIKQILGLCNVTINEVGKINEMLKQHKEELSDTSLEDLFKNMMPNMISYLKRLGKIYTYLESKKDTLNRSYINDKNDLLVVSILLSSFEFKTNLSEFFTDKGINLDKVLSLLHLPNKETYTKELNATELNEKNIIRFSYLTSNGVNYNKSKDAVTPESIVDNIYDKNRTKSSVLQKLYKTVTGTRLDDNFDSTINSHFKSKEERRKQALTESLLENVPIEIYNFLKVLSNYYYSLRNKKLSQVDHEQLSIIMAASRFDPRLENYLDSLGMKRGNLAKAFNFDFSYEERPFDIDIIDKYFKKYIFTGKEITVYSIFENAFRKELTNTINLRNALYKYGKTPEDFLDIKATLDAYDKAKKDRELEDKQEELLANCDKEVRTIMEDTLLIHEYIRTNIHTSELIKTSKDIQEISILIAIFINDENYIPFFIRNGVTLDEILSKVGLDRKTLSDIRRMSVNKSIILEYEKYLRGNKVNIKKLIAALFNDEINNSKVLETITKSTGNNYDYLVEEVSTQKERDLTPEQGYTVLESEEVEQIESPSYSAISTYGDPVSKHSKYINNALHETMFSDTLEHSLDQINELLGQISYEETITVPKKQSFFERLFELEEPPKTVRKYNPEKINELQEQVNIQIGILSKELKGYEFIKKYIELYLRKLNQYLNYLKKYEASLDTEARPAPVDEIEEFTRMLEENSSREILRDKINTFETMILLMKQELVTVHRAIINHFITINSLQTSRSAILPLLATEMAISVGNSSEGEALELTGHLVSLLQNVVNKNIEATKDNLEKLKLSPISEETYAALNKDITSYLQAASRGSQILEQTKPKELPSTEGPKLTL